MTDHKVYRAIVTAVRSGILKEPFGMSDFRKACPSFGDGTYRTFLSKHCATYGKYSALFERVSRGKYRLRLPIRYEE